MQLGDHQSALVAVEDGLSAAAEIGERWWEAGLYRLQGMDLLSLRGAPQAEQCFDTALRVARRQQAKSPELRAATSLAQLRVEQGRREEGRELLAPIHGWFTEGFDTADLKEATALLDQLA